MPPVVPMRLLTQISLFTALVCSGCSEGTRLLSDTQEQSPVFGVGGAGATPVPGSGGAQTPANGAGGTTNSGASTAATGATLQCDTFQGDCNGDLTDGCETPLGSDPSNCGTCGKACGAYPNSTTDCFEGNCQTTCTLGYEDCNSDQEVGADGCETDIKVDPLNCGGCGIECPSGPNAPAGCAGSCYIVCEEGTANCDGDVANGCEANLLTDASNCGYCANKCTDSCVKGACACASESQKAKPLKLDLFVMLDQSGSMSENAAGGTKWELVTSALKSFFENAKSPNLGIGIQYFGLKSSCTTKEDCSFLFPDDTCDAGHCSILETCSSYDYATAEVEIATLTNAQVTALKNSINSHSPISGTPTGPALAGAIQHATDYKNAHPTHAVAVVLATDGLPSSCSPIDISSVAQIASDGLNGSPAIRTFVVGVGELLLSLDKIAEEGGTTAAFLVDTKQDVVKQLKDALNKIQKNALGCKYVIPEPKSGTLDYSKVNVQYTLGSGAVKIVGNVEKKSDCGASSGGWYYDSNIEPTAIILCDATCVKVQADSTAQADLLLGCETTHE